MQITEHVLNDIFGQRFQAPDPRYALLVSHGLGGHSGIYNVFCEHHARRGVDVWAYDAPGHGRSNLTRGCGEFTLAEWVEACVNWATEIKRATGLPIILLGSSLGVAASFGALYAEAVSGAVLMGSGAVPSADGGIPAENLMRLDGVAQMQERLGRALRVDLGRLVNFDEDYGYAGAGEQKRLDPFNTWMYDFASWRSLFTFDPVVKAKENIKPILFAVGEHDALSPPDRIEACAKSIAGPVRYEMMEGAPHQLMLFATSRFSDLIEGWVPTALAPARGTSH